jgi:hypothetical protein
LNQDCKGFDLNQKSEKENEKEIKKRIKGRGDQISPAPDSGRGPAMRRPKSVRISLPPAD